MCDSHPAALQQFDGNEPHFLLNDLQDKPAMAVSPSEESKYVMCPHSCISRIGGQGAVKSWHFLKEHNPVWAARVCGERLRRMSQAIPRPSLHRAQSVRNAFRNRPHMPRPRYRLEQKPELGRAHMAYIDVAAFYIIAVRPPSAAFMPDWHTINF